MAPARCAGSLAIVNVFLIGVWLAGGAGCFWPAWVLLGTGAALALKPAPRPHSWDGASYES